MKIHLNGELREVVTSKNIAELVEELGLPAPTLLIEHNGIALRRSEWTDQTLTDGDRLEMMRIAAGG